MRILALDTSSIVATVAVMEGNRLICETTLNHKKNHSSQLMPLIDEVLTNCHLLPKDIDVFGVSLGPGSFTGLRIGITTIKAMAQALQKPVAGVSTLDGLAYNLSFSTHLICPIIDAQRDHVYTALYKCKGGKLNRLSEYKIQHISEAFEEVKQKKEPTAFLGDGVEKFKDNILQELHELAIIPPSSVTITRASSIAALAYEMAEEGSLMAAEDILPFYMRKSQAEKQFDERMKG